MHEIFGNRFIGRRPAWHGLGEVIGDENVSAVEALRRMGEYEVELIPVFTEVETPTGPLTIPLPERVILRHPTSDDDQYRAFGVVGPEYLLVTPFEAATIWDERVAQPVETIGALRDGARLFITTVLPDLDVHGEEVEMYLLAAVPMDGEHAIETAVTPVCVVCQNTLTLGLNIARDRYSIPHDRHAKERMGDWLQDAYESAVANVEVLSEAFDLLAGTHVSKRQETKVLDLAYPLPSAPRANAPGEVMEVRLEAHERRSEQIKGYRETAHELFHGEGTGADLEVRKGTAWGLYNSVCETEDYRKASNRSTEQTLSEQRVFGERAAVKARAFDACMELAAS